VLILKSELNLVKILLENGADPNAIATDKTRLDLDALHHTDVHKHRMVIPLTVAIATKDVAIAREILNHPAFSMNQSNFEFYYSPLNMAIAQDDLKMLQLLFPKFSNELNLITNSSLYERLFYMKEGKTYDDYVNIKYQMQGSNYTNTAPVGVYTRKFVKNNFLGYYYWRYYFTRLPMETPLMRACAMGNIC
jgi:ankyrin repeat protein